MLKSESQVKGAKGPWTSAGFTDMKVNGHFKVKHKECAQNLLRVQ